MSFKERGSKLSKLGNSSLPVRLTPEVIERFYQALDCPRSLTALILFRNGEYDQLVSLECDPSHYSSSETFRDAYLASSFLTKSQFLETSFDRRQLAINKFNQFEDGCREVNIRFKNLSRSGVESSERGALLIAMRQKIDRILGDFDPEELFELSSWGPGVSTLIKGDETFGAKKFQHEVGITRDLYPLVKDLFPLTYPSWWSLLESKEEWPTFQVGNAVVTVPKTSKIDRVIAIEPGLNLWFQLGLGRMIRRRLGRVGIDLTDQSRNQQLALSSSITGDLATVDFSSASDSIAFGLVEDLFQSRNSFRWFEVMDLIRSKYGTIDGKIFRWNKFSSMGNGFTFDLETLIFYSAAIVCCEAAGVSIEGVSVYGDDVIIPSVCYGSFCSLCELLGFTVNQKKSFSSGNFRESCGAHYFEGIDCKPLYLEGILSLPSRVFNFANTLRIRSHHSGYFHYCDARFRSLFYFLVSSLPKTIRFRVSAVQNEKSKEIEPLEGGFLSNLDEACPIRLRHYIEGYSVRRFSWVSIQKEVDYPGLLLARLSSLPVKSEVPFCEDFRFTGPGWFNWHAVLFDCVSAVLPNLVTKSLAEGNYNPLRGRTRCILTNTSVRQWYDLGPWL